MGDCSYYHDVTKNKNIMILHQSSSMFQNCSYNSAYHEQKGTTTNATTSLRYLRHQYLLSHYGMRYACGLMKNIMNDTTTTTASNNSSNALLYLDYYNDNNEHIDNFLNMHNINLTTIQLSLTKSNNNDNNNDILLTFHYHNAIINF